MAKTNPQKANQYKPDPRQTDALAKYFDPTSPTYSKLTDSLIAAGYSEKYADSFQRKARTWLQESASQVTRDELVTQAKQNLKELLVTDDEKIKADITKFVAKTDAEFSEKTDITSAGKEIQPLLVKFVEDDK